MFAQQWVLSLGTGSLWETQLISAEGENGERQKKLHCITLRGPGHLKTLRSYQILDQMTWKKFTGKSLHQKGWHLRGWKGFHLGWMKEGVSEYAQSHTRKRDMGKEMGAREKDCRENKSSFPQGIDWHLHIELAFSTKATSILSKVGLFREHSLFLVYIELTPQPCPWARLLCFHVFFFHHSLFLSWFLEAGLFMYACT